MFLLFCFSTLFNNFTLAKRGCFRDCSILFLLYPASPTPFSVYRLPHSSLELRMQNIRFLLESLIVLSSNFFLSTTRLRSATMLTRKNIHIREGASCDGETTTNTGTHPKCFDTRCRTARQGRRAAPPASRRK